MSPLSLPYEDISQRRPFIGYTLIYWDRLKDDFVRDGGQQKFMRSLFMSMLGNNNRWIPIQTRIETEPTTEPAIERPLEVGLTIMALSHRGLLDVDKRWFKSRPDGTLRAMVVTGEYRYVAPTEKAFSDLANIMVASRAELAPIEPTQLAQNIKTMLKKPDVAA